MVDMHQKTSWMKSLLNEIDQLQGDIFNITEEKKQKDNQTEDLKTQIKTTDLKLKHLNDALGEFQHRQ